MTAIRRSLFVPTPVGPGSAQQTVDVAYINGANNVYVTNFGAKGDGVADDTAAIQAAINSIPSGGGIVYFPPGIYVVSSTITIGNGTSSTNSTVNGVRLIGIGGMGASALVNSAFPGSVVLRWAGTIGGGPVVSFVGPMTGWGFENFVIDGITTAAPNVGISVRSCAYGRLTDVAVFGCRTDGVLLQTWDPFTVLGTTDNLHNTYINLYVNVPNVVSARGLTLKGGGTSTVTTDTTFECFVNNTFQLPTSASTTYGIYLQVCDSNVFLDTHIIGAGAGNVGIQFDYSLANVFPNSNKFYGVDNAMTTQYAVAGTPSVNTALLNEVFGIMASNGGRAPKNIANFAYNGGFEIGYTAPGVAIGTAVTQSGTTGSPVTANAICGTITTVNASWTGGLANGAVFTVNNNQVATTDAIKLTQATAAGVNVSFLPVPILASTAGSFNLGLIPTNTATSIAVINFSVIKGVNT